MKQVIFDSSFLMAVAETPTAWEDDIVERTGKFEPTVLTCVRDELAKLAAGHGRRSRAARASLELSSGFRLIPTGRGKADDEIVSVALASGGLVATLDEELIGTLKALGVGVIRLRSGRVTLG